MALVVKSQLKELAKKHGAAMSEEAIEALEKEVEALVEKAVKRAEANGRKTVKARDI